MRRLTLRFSDAFDRLLADLAAREGIPKTRVVRRAVALLQRAVEGREQGRPLLETPTGAERDGRATAAGAADQAGAAAPEPVRLEALEARLPEAARVELPLIGRELARWILLLLALSLVLVTAYAVLTRPSLTELQQALGAEQAFTAYRELRQAWYQEVRGLLELLLPLLLTILGTVVGYTFGRQQSS
jgi:hypothetical protein